jgi:hypothetical protein
MKHKVIFIIVPSYSNNAWLDDKMMQLTSAFISILNVDDYPVEIVEHYADCNKFLDQANYLVVSTAGNFIIERDHLHDKINSIPKDVGLVAHLLQFPSDRTPYIHEQFFIINTQAVSLIDLSFSKFTVQGTELIRSREDLHDGHAPLYIELGTDIVERDMRFGTSLIEQCLTNGYKVRNFDMDWRYPSTANEYITLHGKQVPSRGYCYPLLNTDLFAECFKDLTIRPGLDEAQEWLLTAINKVLDFDVLNYWQYDSTPKDLPDVKRVVCAANGFLGELIAFNTGATKITFYDINPNNLEFKKHLYANWDGVNYELFARDWAKERNLGLEPALEIDKAMAMPLMSETEHSIFSIWSEWKDRVQIEYIYMDIIKDVDRLVLNKNCVIHTSTILSVYPFTAVVHDRPAIDTAIEKIKRSGAYWVGL